MQSPFIQKVNNFSQAVAKQRHFAALRDGFVIAIPFLIAAGIFILINFVFLDPNGFVNNILQIEAETLQKVQILGNKVLNGSMNIFTLLIIVFSSNSLSLSKGYKNSAIPIAVAIGAFFVISPNHFTFNHNGEDLLINGSIQMGLLGTQGIFMGIFASLFATELYIKFATNSRFKIALGENVPPAVEASFNAIIPICLTLLIFGSISFLCIYFTGYEIQELINNIIREPLVGFTTSPFGFLILFIVGVFLFSLGIHPSGVIPFVEPILITASLENQQAFAAGLEIPNIITGPFRDMYGHIGGTGQTLALIIAVFLVGKTVQNKSFAKITMPTTFFNINEPIIFGFPIVFNPILMIPFVLVPVVSLVIAYIVTYAGLISKIVVYVPWSTPPLLNAWIASGGDFRNVIFQFLILALSVAIYIPFLRIHENSMQSTATKSNEDEDFSEFAEFKK